MSGSTLGRLLNSSLLGTLVRPWESRFAQKWILPQITSRPHAAPNLDGLPLIRSRTARERLQYTFETGRPGISVIASPRECGKTTTLITGFNDYLAAKGHGLFFAPNSLQSGRDARDAFLTRCGGEQRSHDLCDIMPLHSTIVFDQVEQMFSEPMISVLKSLMTESMRSRNVSIVVAVGTVEKARLLLDLNGGEKVRLLCSPSAFRWGAAEIDQLIAAYDERNSSSVKLGTLIGLRELALQSGTAGFLTQFEERLRSDGQDKAKLWGQQRVREDEELWKSFEDLEKNQ